MRIAECGQTIAHLPQSMHRLGSQIGISSAIPRFELRGAAGPGAVDRHRADRQQIALATQHRRGDLLDEVRRTVGHRRHPMDRGGAGFGDPQRLQRGDGTVDGREVALHHRASAAAVGRLDGGLDLRDRIGARNHARQIEEAGLHHGVDAFAQAGSVCDGSGVDHPDRQLTLDDQIADLGGQLVPGAVAVGRVEQHGGTGLGQIECASGKAARTGAPRRSRPGR